MVSATELPPDDGHQVGHGLDARLVGLVEEDPEAVLDLGGQGEQADGVEAEILDEPHVHRERPLPVQALADDLGDAFKDHGFIHLSPSASSSARIRTRSRKASSKLNTRAVSQAVWTRGREAISRMTAR